MSSRHVQGLRWRLTNCLQPLKPCNWVSENLISGHFSLHCGWLNEAKCVDERPVHLKKTLNGFEQ